MLMFYNILQQTIHIMVNHDLSCLHSMLFVLILLSFFSHVQSYCSPNVACFAPPIDVAKLPTHKLTLNSTCGSPPEYFCVDEDCSLKCDTTNNQTWHPKEYILDDYESLTYWKSKNFDEPVFIQFDFNYTLILHQITLTFQFELPNGMYIQRSQDFGTTFKTLAYFAIQCNDIFDMAESLKYNKLEVVCFSINPGTIQRQISYAPRRDDYVSTEVLKGGFVRDFYLASNIKIILHEYFKPSDFSTTVADRRKYYFAILDIDVQAACYCNGMAEKCLPGNYGTCICQKNTEGSHCERCMSLYNNKRWTFGRACEDCKCNNHSTDCVYDQTKRYGVCNDCKHNTKGDKCESCAIGFYRNNSEAISHPDSCISCNCFQAGVLSGSVTCDPNIGRCYCKKNVGSLLCDKCKDGYYGLSSVVSSGCLPCGCRHTGSVGGSAICDKNTGLCPCILGFTGRTCSICVKGYFGYPVYNPTECRECNCQPSGAVGMLCDKTGQCTCRRNYYGVKCEQIKIGYYSASVGQLLLSSKNAVITSPISPSYQSLNITDSSGNTFFVLGYSVGLGGSLATDTTQLKFSVQIPATTLYEFYLQYITSYGFEGVSIRVELKSPFQTYTCDNGKVVISSVTYKPLKSNIRSSKEAKLFGSHCLMKGFYDIFVAFPPTSAGELSSIANIFLMSLLLLPNYKQAPRFLSATSRIQSNVMQYYQLATSYHVWPKEELQGAPYLSYVYGSYYDSAFECGCDRIGSINPLVCNIYGGQCNCKKNIYGRICQRCLPRYYNFSSGLGCDACNCDVHGSFNKECNYYSGQCKCKPNVIGRTCNKCILQHHGISSGQGCKACDCMSLYSVSSQCNENGNCHCKSGVGGAKCDKCAPGYFQLSINGCIRCTCNPVGTSGNKCNPTTGSCTCKALTTGGSCDQCKYGYYGFSSDYPEACLPCHCSAQTKECDAANDYYLMNVSTIFSTDVNNNAIQGWSSVDVNGYATGETSWDWAPVYAIERGYAKLLDNGGTSAVNLYFSAANIFLGYKMSSYMYFLRFDLTQEQTSRPLGDSNVGDIIIKGVGLKYKLVTKLTLPPPFHQNFRSYSIQFHEKRWHKDNLDGPQPTSMEMRTTLSNLEFIWIRGKWTKENGKFSGLANVFMDYSSYNITIKTGLREVRNVEYCTCPLQYSGQFCQNCNDGFSKVSTTVGSPFSCTACKCNNHSKSCDPNNGTCFDCMHKTKGSYCEKCVAGYYGNPTIGQPHDCKGCACPGGLLEQNQFANDCVLNGKDKANPYRCLQCQQGYSGYRCHVCSDGYYGNPMDPLGKCKKCVCNGNVNPQASSNCNTTTGECLRCLFDTIGHSCEFCRPGFFGNALSRSCRDCSCSAIGSFDNNCQNITGQCNCKPNVIGRMCKTCAENTFNFGSNRGCELCKCNELGSTSQQCDSISGKCACKKSVIGNKCDTCAPGFYNLGNGCLRCNCNPDYSMRNATCDPVTGQCVCIKSRLGGVYSGRTCHECDVNAIGTPPNCELCHSPCYDNWQTYIDNEAADIGSTQGNLTDILSKFGSLGYNRVKEHLNWLRSNLTYITDIFTSGTYNTSMKEQQFQQIQNYIIEFETALKQTQQQISRSVIFFETTVSNFNGTIPLSSLVTQPLPIHQVSYRQKRNIPKKHSRVNARIVIQIGNSYKQATYNNKIKGKNIYLAIQKQFEKIVAANASVFDAAQKLSKSILGLSEAATERKRVSTFFDSQYRSRFAVSAYDLKKIHDVVVSVVLLQNHTVAIYKNAISTMNSIKTIAAHSERQADFQGTQALTVVQTLSRMKVNSLTLNAAVSYQISVSAELKRKVKDELFNVQKETLLLAQGIKDLASAKDKTSDAMVIARDISEASVPVTISEIQSLSSQIINTIINEGIINATYTDAQHGLITAKEVQARSQQALDVSRSTLLNIQNLEVSLDKSAEIRSNSQLAFSNTDMKVDSLQNITSMIENQFNAVSGEGGVTLSLLEKSIADINGNEMCFLNTKFVIENATIVSGFAAAKANDALKMHQMNEKVLPNHSTKINTIYKQVLGMKTKAETASKTSGKLLEDVTTAEILLKQFVVQKAELDELQIESEKLEAELSEIVEKFEQYQLKVSSCNKP